MSRRVVDYDIVDVSKPDGRERLVRDFLNKGWELYGFPLVVVSGNLVQAVVKYDVTECLKDAK